MSNETINKKALSLPEMLKVVWRVNGLVWKEKKWTIVSLIVLLVVLAAAPIGRSGLQGLFINELVKIAGSKVFNEVIVVFLAGAIALDVMSSFLIPLQRYLRQGFALHLRQHFQLMVLKKKGELDIAAHENPENLTLIEKINQQGVWRIEYMAGNQLQIASSLVTMVVTSAVLGAAQWWVLVIIIAGTVPEMIVGSRLAVGVWKRENKQAEKRRHLWDMKYLFDEAHSVMELKIFGNVKYFYERVKKLWQDLLREDLEEEKRRALAQLSSLFLSNVSMGVATVWFVWEVVQGKMEIGTMTFLLASIISFRGALSAIFSEVGYFYENTLFASDVLRLMDAAPVIQSSVPGVVIPKEKTPEIIFDNVTFSYPGAQKPSLTNFSLKIAPGEKIAFVGVNGAGKTTFIKLLCRFYDPQEGRVLIDGNDLRTINLESWYEHLGVIFQDFTNYRLITKDAIGLGNSQMPVEIAEVQKAAHSAEADAFIQEWKRKYDQPLGKIFQEGVQPSGGQWQKLALSRVFFRQANVLILDEPTSAIDAEAEAKIFAQMAALPKDKTVILISHRFSTVRQADRIVVIDGGKMIEVGSHQELLEKDGTYAKLFNLQAKGYA